MPDKQAAYVTATEFTLRLHFNPCTRGGRSTYNWRMNAVRCEPLSSCRQPADDRATKPKLGAQTIRLTPGREPSSFLISRFSAASYVTDVVEPSTEVARQAGAVSEPKPFLSAKVAAPSQ
jgi:hypothetical protein